MSLKNLFVVVILLAVLFAAPMAVLAQDAGNQALRSNMPTTDEIEIQAPQAAERTSEQNGVPQGKAEKVQKQEGPCGPACRRNQEVEPISIITPKPTVTPPTTVITITEVVTVTVFVEVEAPCPNVIERETVFSCNDFQPAVYTCGTYRVPEPQAASQEAKLPFWLAVLVTLGLVVGAAAIYGNARGVRCKACGRLSMRLNDDHYCPGCELPF